VFGRCSKQRNGRVLSMDTLDASLAVKRGRPAGSLTAKRKVSVTLRLDADVLAHLRATGRGWQTRINALLREAVEAGRV